MPQNVTLIRLHVSAAADVSEERRILGQVVAKLQNKFGSQNDVRLELVEWSSSLHPEMSRAQQVINQQIPATDIFIGILWSRFGIPTSKAGSGTEEEFTQAYKSWQVLGRPQMLFYFSSLPIYPSLIDPNQFIKVVEFKKSLADSLLYRSYETIEQFRKLVESDLLKVIPPLLDTAISSRKPPRVFYSYAHEDEELREEFAKHLRVLERNQVIESWYDHMIAPGAEWSKEIAKQLESADIIALLVSSDFLDSDYCYNIEMKRALKRHKLGEVQVLPIIVRASMWEESPLSELKALPKDAIPVTLWTNRDEAWTDVARGIKLVANSFN